MTEVESPTLLPVAAAPDIDAADFAFHHSSPHSLKDTFSSPPAPPLQSYNYNFSSRIYDESSASASNTDHENDYTTEEEDGLLHADRDGGAASVRTSISSLPVSVLPEEEHSILKDETELETADISTKSPKILHHHRSGSLGYKIKSPGSGSQSIHALQNGREYSPAFRNPSSVRAMQMRDESVFNDDPEDVKVRSLSGHRRRGSRMSTHSHRSSGSTQTSPTKQRRGSPLKRSSGPKTEFPLVLLHCTLLPPTLGNLSMQGHLSDDALLREVLPDLYWRRWKVLKEKVVDNVEARQRGVLVPHPRGEYEILEERLLESLELERVRVREGHYLRKVEAETDDDVEESEDDATLSGEMRTKCPDCGTKVSMEVEMERKWEVKVYAANGLMRAGAWNAAWQEMEKVDIEVGVWMPEDVRRGVEERLAELDLNAYEDGAEEHEETLDEDQRRRREVYGNSDGPTQEDIDGMFEEHSAQTPGNIREAGRGFEAHYQSHQATLLDLILSYFRALMQDRKNVLIAFLSILVLFYAMQKPADAALQPVVATNASLEVATELPQLPVMDIPQATVEMTTMTVTATTTAFSVSTVTVSETIVPASQSPAEQWLVESSKTPSVEEGAASWKTNAATETSTSTSTSTSTEGTEAEEPTQGVAEVVLDMLFNDDFVE